MTPDAPRPDLDDAERWAERVADGAWATANETLRHLPVLFAEYRRRGATMVELDVALAERDVLVTDLREAVRTASAESRQAHQWLAEAQAEAEAYRDVVRAARHLIAVDDLETETPDWVVFDTALSDLRRALAAAPAPAEDGEA